MRSSPKLSARPPVWIAGISVCLLAVSGVVALLRSIPASYAGTPDKGTASEYAAPSDAAADDPKSDLAVAPTISHRSGASCRECGIVASIREIGRPEAPNRQDAPDVKAAARVSGGAIRPGAMTRKSYEITVRFHDGSTTVFNEVGPRTWRLGARVIMIGRSLASN